MKQIKDPLYGYIEIEDKYIPLIDSAEFQRLRNIRQTGYAALYPSALHNRFVHSLGVFHLGKKAIANFQNNIKDKFYSANWEIWEETFILACLLHDVGHSPFSHTGEEFYRRSTNFPELFANEIGSKELDKDINNQMYGKPHEAMSAYVGCKLIDSLGTPFHFDKELFVRAIIGVTYDKDYHDSLVLNTIIGMLNGNVNDVDKLDYLIRDSYVTGYSSMVIDADRLLTGYTIASYISEDNKPCQVAAYKKSVLSVVENIAYANDLERRWIQNNPTVTYDCKLIEIAIKQYNDYMTTKYQALSAYNNVFNLWAISKDGFPKKDDIPLRLLSDDDIITYLKNECDNEISTQYFSRDKRYKPLWKSEAEFVEVVKGELSARILRELKSALYTLTSAKDVFFINETIYISMMNELKNSSKINKADSKKIETERNTFKIFQIMKGFRGSHGLDFEFAVIYESHFESSYKKLAVNDIFIELAPNHVVRLDKTLPIHATSSSEEEKQGLFYIYTSRKNIEKIQANRKSITNLLIKYIAMHWDDDVAIE